MWQLNDGKNPFLADGTLDPRVKLLLADHDAAFSGTVSEHALAGKTRAEILAGVAETPAGVVAPDGAEKDKEKGIWYPTVVFKNTNEKHKSKVDEETYIKVNKSGKFLTSPASDYLRERIFKGKENPIIMQRYYREVFTCE